MRFLILPCVYLTLTLECHGEPKAFDTNLLLDAIQRVNEKETPFENMNEVPIPPEVTPKAALYELNADVLPWMFDVDMLLSEEQARSLVSESSDRQKRAAIIDPRYHWNPQIPINYTFDSSITNDSYTLAVVKQGINFWADNTCLNFQYNPLGRNVLNIFVGVGCWSYVGRQGTATQDVSIGIGCNSLGTVTHELAHALGFYHQQSRYDRDAFITINFTNIDLSLQYNFAKQTIATETHFGWPYDYSSIMQYGAFAFAVNRNFPTIVAKKSDYQSAMGQRDSPAFSDVVMVNTLYNCSNLCTTLPSCQNNGIPNSRNCSQCICPTIYSGDLCSDFKIGNAVTCAGSTEQAESCWKVLSGTAGRKSDYTAYDKASDCYWMIQERLAPQGSQVEIQITFTTLCQDYCPWQWLELFIDEFTLGGMEICCPSDKTFVSIRNQLAIRAMSKWSQNRFSLKYRIQSNDTTPDCGTF